jgi:hypothetical protein
LRHDANAEHCVVAVVLDSIMFNQHDWFFFLAFLYVSAKRIIRRLRGLTHFQKREKNEHSSMKDFPRQREKWRCLSFTNQSIFRTEKERKELVQCTNTLVLLERGKKIYMQCSYGIVIWTERISNYCIRKKK